MRTVAAPLSAFRWASISLALLVGMSECLALLRARLRQQAVIRRPG